MDNRADEKTTINVKSVSVAAWDRAKKAATKQGEAMGEWLSRAINQLADIEAGPREFPPAHPPVNQISETGNPMRFALSPAELADLMQAQAALTTATGKLPAKADTGRAHALAAEMVRAAIGMPPKPLRIGKAPAKKINKTGNPNPSAAPDWPKNEQCGNVAPPPGWADAKADSAQMHQGEPGWAVPNGNSAEMGQVELRPRGVQKRPLRKWTSP